MLIIRRNMRPSFSLRDRMFKSRNGICSLSLVSCRCKVRYLVTTRAGGTIERSWSFLPIQSLLASKQGKTGAAFQKRCGASHTSLSLPVRPEPPTNGSLEMVTPSSIPTLRWRRLRCPRRASYQRSWVADKARLVLPLIFQMRDVAFESIRFGITTGSIVERRRYV